MKCEEICWKKSIWINLNLDQLQTGWQTPAHDISSLSFLDLMKINLDHPKWSRLWVFHCDVQRNDISGIVIVGFEMSDVGYVLVLSDEVADGVNMFYISPLDVG